jgi:hypothetical protein
MGSAAEATLAVMRRLTALMLILVVAIGAVAATPLPACLPECGMEGGAGMDMMGRCRDSHRYEHASAPSAPSAEVCCLHGSQATTSGTITPGAPRLPQSNTARPHAAALPPSGFAPPAAPAKDSPHATASSTKPAYILHLSLLI